ncbi:PLP-dependent transferase, partial [Halalkalibacter flavus]|uniref:PLP-dependent transferase n=1 Tax=Halalkalibacter flavus TaxID=3090668 RepID=UPI002FCC02AD
MGFSTDAIHFGQEHDPATGAVMVPIHLSSIFAQKELGEGQSYQYSRTGNPTRAALEKCLAQLEAGRHGFAFASGVAAIHASLTLL